MRNHVDLPRLEALNRQWRDFPPLAVQLRRLSQYFGMKPDASENAPASDSEKQAEQSMQLAEMFEVRPMPKIMSQEEYLAQRAERMQQGNQDGL